MTAETRENPFRVVLFDWRGTLVHDPDDRWWVSRALRQLDRPVRHGEVSTLVARLERAKRLPEHVDADLRIDTSSSFHREASLRLYEDAGFDEELAVTLYELDFDMACHPLYVDTLDVLTDIRARNVKIAVVSDIHFDLRAEFVERRMGHLIDTFVLSFEHGIQKPDRRMFEIALEAAGVGAASALMVGDRASHDGGAASLGITTLILPAPSDLKVRRLDSVMRLLI